ncbi:unnamed protein product [Prorocentrum cordatum]|uniref:Uncharacterized protein n=1 Tax=Prorocentrum cordatum TaxID=2364126 RepID=A0ABN9UK28_9DINO|nr:unnamed protein product [Polarella glacialis]
MLALRLDQVLLRCALAAWRFRRRSARHRAAASRLAYRVLQDQDARIAFLAFQALRREALLGRLPRPRGAPGAGRSPTPPSPSAPAAPSPVPRGLNAEARCLSRVLQAELERCALRQTLLCWRAVADAGAAGQMRRALGGPARRRGGAPAEAPPASAGRRCRPKAARHSSWGDEAWLLAAPGAQPAMREATRLALPAPPLRALSAPLLEPQAGGDGALLAIVLLPPAEEE